MLSTEEVRRLRDGCSRFLVGHGPIRARDLLEGIPPDTEVDQYGVGGAVAELETEVADLLGKPEALFLPSGTMAQQITLRVHADGRHRRTVLYHPACHLEHHEGRALQRLQGLTGRPVGHTNHLLRLADLTAVAELPAALLLELPQRDLGGEQPVWDDLQAQLAWARDRDVATHLDGARLWESAAGYGRTSAQVAAGFTSVYVSFYKGIGALPGCCIAGEPQLVAEVREWRQRMGGTLFGMWPNAASALTLLRQRLPAMPRYLGHARAIAAALRDKPGVRVLPDPPQTPMMHLLLAVPQVTLDANVRWLAETRDLWTFRDIQATADPQVQRVELSVGEATCELSAEEAADAICVLLSSAANTPTPEP